MPLISRQKLKSLSTFKPHLQPQLKKRTLTHTNTPDSLSFNKFRATTQAQDEHQYSQLALKSLDKNFPLSQLKPFSSFYSIDKIQQKIINQEHEFKPFHNKKRHTMYAKMLFPKRPNTDSKNTTFYQSRTKFKKSKSKFNTMTNLNYPHSIDQEEHMVVEFVKQDKQILKRQKRAFQWINQKISNQFPQHFEPNYQHQDQKCRSLTCNQGFFKRRKYKVQEKYDIEQPGVSHRFLKTKVPKKQKTIKEDISFCVFAKRKNRILNTEQPAQKMSQTIKEQVSMTSVLDMPVVLREKFRAQSAVMYKKYLRSSFKGKKAAMIQDMQIGFD